MTTKVGGSEALCICHHDNLYTFVLRYPRMIHSEFMTHRCLTADTVLTFDLPSGSKGSKCKAYQMTLGDFWDKWENGSSPHTTRWGGVRRYDMKGRLNKMRLRSVDESTMEVTHTTITDCWKVGVKPVYKLTAGDFSVTCTADHLILTDSGWKELQDIDIGKDKVYCNTRKKYTEPYFDPYKKINGEWVSSWNAKVKPEHSRQGWQGVSQCNLMAVEVDLIECIGEEEVFDISVSSDYHNFLANGITVHNCFSRNASSSRAIPVNKVIEQVDSKPVVPTKVYMNKAGMVGDVEAPIAVATDFYNLWLDAARNAVETAKCMEKLGIHKQHINRILEPFQYINVIVTATDWDNFLNLRLASDAQPEMQDLARAIKCEMDKVGNKIISVYRICGKYVSLPFITQEEVDSHCMNSFSSSEVLIEDLMLISSARCARVSYNNHDGSCPDEHKDKKLARRLLEAGHMSPMEHPCIWAGDMRYNKNLYGWKSLRCKLGR